MIKSFRLVIKLIEIAILKQFVYFCNKKTLMKYMSETETVIKRILPYLSRRGYDIDKDLKFEEPTELDTDKRKGFIDILVTCGKKTPIFAIEAKRDGTKLTAKHRKQAIEYGQSLKCLFVSITNGQMFELLNVSTKKPLKLNESAFNKIPTRDDLLKKVIPQLKKDPKAEQVFILTDKSIPFRPGLPQSKLNHLIKKSHSLIRKIEKNEEHAFSDFSKILFLKLLEEKWDMEETHPPYSYSFHELARTPKDRSDQVKIAITSMISTIRSSTKFGEVLDDPIRLKKDNAYLAIVKIISGVSWNDCDLDSKGAAFEHFVRATLKGKKLGQYFTPRSLVKLMLHLGKYQQIVNNVLGGMNFKVLDPACGTGGFLVYGMNICIEEIEQKYNKGEIHKTLRDKAVKKLKQDTFFGIDAHEGVASSAKMNMIIAGDGHNNIQCKDTLKIKKMIPKFKDETGAIDDTGKAHLILANPPFGTSEGESLTTQDLNSYTIKSTKGQSLFIQQMIKNVKSNSRIVTVIDEGVLNTMSYKELRSHIMQECKIEYIISLPDETFKPNKINVKSSVLVLIKRENSDMDLEDEYPISYIKIKSLGYDGAGNDLRGFNLNELIESIINVNPYKLNYEKLYDSYYNEYCIVSSLDIAIDNSTRFDYKYWVTSTISKINAIKKQKGSKTISEINIIETKRGKSPSSSEYVSEDEGFSLVIKAGSNVSKNGRLITKGDYIEKHTYQFFFDKEQIINDGDILLSSTGDGTLGKCCVYRNYDEEGNTKPAIADSHVTIIRVNQEEIYPEYLCDYLRKGFGSEQVNRLFTGATGLIELTPEDVSRIYIPKLPKMGEQKKRSKELREKEDYTLSMIERLIKERKDYEEKFFKKSYK